jgi:DHA2 family multidrug resistance protein
MVSGIINFMRNIGSGVGTSMVTTLVARRAQYHQSILVEHLTPGHSTFLNSVDGMTAGLIQAGFNVSDAQARAHAVVYQATQRQAMTLAYIDTFWVLAVAAAIMFGLSFALRKNEPGGGGHAEI